MRIPVNIRICWVINHGVSTPNDTAAAAAEKVVHVDDRCALVPSGNFASGMHRHRSLGSWMTWFMKSLIIFWGSNVISIHDIKSILLIRNVSRQYPYKKVQVSLFQTLLGTSRDKL